jgi:hypothetical protein
LLLTAISHARFCIFVAAIPDAFWGDKITTALILFVIKQRKYAKTDGFVEFASS